MTPAGPLAATTLALAAVLAPAAVRPRPVLLWNATASAPVGLYHVHTGGRLRRGDWVAVEPPPAFGQMLAARGYLPPHVPLVKQVAALSPSQVCRTGAMVSVDGTPRAVARGADRQGRALPVWQGCRALTDDEMFLLNPARDSLDSRYFGPLRGRAVIGRLTLLWRVRGAAP